MSLKRETPLKITVSRVDKALLDGGRDDLVSPVCILSVQVPVSFSHILMSGFQERGTSVRVEKKAH